MSSLIHRWKTPAPVQRSTARLVITKLLAVRDARGAQIDATHLSEEYRLEVLAILLDVVAKQGHAGVDQGNLSPRNVIIPPAPTGTLEETRPQCVVLIDYDSSTVYELTEYGKRPAQRARLPPNPMVLIWTATLSDLAGWAPPGLCWNRRLRREWLRGEFGGEKEALYEPLGEELELHEAPPEEVAALQYLDSLGEKSLVSF
ncbi:hypothetical protein DHEL01_v212243 [Diaporthe helianthi]|uniref:Uncharacterized protein n=1 Tax=Diaporthe helianthi TaxID=158607 RepID=A0A2P5HGJ8_DIAHE|nr:hypothetical protein DHEL01_v212243 [Diaporthe helianthi]